MRKIIERDENLELKEKHTIILVVLDMKRKNMRYNVVVTGLHAFFVSASSSIVIQASFPGANEKRVLSRPAYS